MFNRNDLRERERRSERNFSSSILSPISIPSVFIKYFKPSWCMCHVYVGMYDQRA